MIQKDKELLIKDLSARLPYGVKLHKTYEECDSLELRSLDIGNDKLVFYKYKGEVLTICDADDIERFGQIKYKPYLFPLSSMNEEQKEYIRNRFCYEWEGDPYEIWRHQIDIEDADELIDWFNKNHFDYRCLIPKDLAIDATGLNIY